MKTTDITVGMVLVAKSGRYKRIKVTSVAKDGAMFTFAQWIGTRGTWSKNTTVQSINIDPANYSVEEVSDLAAWDGVTLADRASRKGKR